MCGDILLCLIHGMVSVYACVLCSLIIQTELSVTISVDYIAAPGEDPGELGPNAFTASSILSLYCIVEGASGDVTYSWSAIGSSTPPAQCGDCDIERITSFTTPTLPVGRPLHSHHAGTYTCTVSETGRPGSSSDDYIVIVVGEMIMCVL